MLSPDRRCTKDRRRRCQAGMLPVDRRQAFMRRNDLANRITRKRTGRRRKRQVPALNICRNIAPFTGIARRRCHDPGIAFFLRGIIDRRRGLRLLVLCRTVFRYIRQDAMGALTLGEARLHRRRAGQHDGQQQSSDFQLALLRPPLRATRWRVHCSGTARPRSRPARRRVRRRGSADNRRAVPQS